MADGEGEGDPRESQATKQNGLSLPKQEPRNPSPSPSESSISMGLSGQDSDITYGRRISDDSVDPLQEAPLDFSVKRTGSSSIPVQNLNNKLANGLHRGMYEQKKHSREQQHGSSLSKSERHSPNVNDDIPAIKTEAVSPPPHVNGSSPSSNGTRCTSGDSPETRIGEPQIALPGTLPASVLHGGAAGLLPILPPGIVPTSGMLNGLSLTPDTNDSKHTQNGKSTRPFTAYTKEQLNFPPPFGALPALPQIPGLDMITAHAMAANSEEVFAQYKQYVMALQEQIRSQTSPGGSSTSSSQGQKYSGVHSPPGSGQEFTALPPTVSPSQFNIPTSPENSSRSAGIYRNSGGSRKRGKSLPDDQKDEAYWERRRKNNEAAKRSRDARRAKEDEIAIRAAFLEQENLKLRVEVAALKTETARLRCQLYNS